MNQSFRDLRNLGPFKFSSMFMLELNKFETVRVENGLNKEQSKSVKIREI